MRAATSGGELKTTGAMRDRVTVDLRGLRPQLQAQAAKRQMTAAAWVRRAVTAMLDDPRCDAVDSESIDGTSGTQVVKVTLRLPVAHAVVLASRARGRRLARTYIARLIDGSPPPPRALDHTRVVAALMASTAPFALVVAEAFDRGMTVDEWRQWTVPPADPALMAALKGVWLTEVWSRFVQRYTTA